MYHERSSQNVNEKDTHILISAISRCFYFLFSLMHPNHLTLLKLVSIFDACFLTLFKKLQATHCIREG